jgi:uracil-DNA glycosylase family 4
MTGEPFGSPVPPGTGWPDDPADATTPVATTAARVRRTAGAADELEGPEGLDAAISVCRACRRLVRWREDVAVTKRASFADQPYWGRPVPGWGDSAARVVVVGLAPAANGANRTGRNFTGDSSGDWLYASLHRVGLAALPTSTHAGDGQRLHGTRMVAPVRCAPPANKPTPVERDTCEPWLVRELSLLAPTMRVVVALGSFGWAAALRGLAAAGYVVGSPRPRFGHAVEVELPGGGPDGAVVLLGCYHPSQHNTFTGRLSEEMLDAVLGRAARLAGPAGPTG